MFETRPKRTQDKYRFELRKEGEVDAYVVSFQDDTGDRAQCSCKGWVFRRQDCKHCKMCRAEFFTATTRRAAPTQTPTARALPAQARALPAAQVREDQLALPGMDELSELTKKLNETRAAYKAKKIEVDAAQALFDTLRAELADLESTGHEIKNKIQKHLQKSKAA